jgi:hypothetical protein
MMLVGMRVARVQPALGCGSHCVREQLTMRDRLKAAEDCGGGCEGENKKCGRRVLFAACVSDLA